MVDSQNVNFGSGQAIVNFPELRKIKSRAEDLIAEITSRTADTLSQARSVASRASNEYDSKANVPYYAKSVISQCDNLSNAKTSAINELTELVRGIDRIIAGYLNLEDELARTQ